MAALPALRCAAAVMVMTACGGPPEPARQTTPVVAWAEHEGAAARWSARMPTPVRERHVPEGRMQAHIAHADDADGTGYEVAAFVMPGPLDAAAQRELLRKVVLGLSGARGATVRSADSVGFAGLEALALEVDRGGGELGRWRIFFADSERMFQGSVVGPDTPERRNGEQAFFRSFRLRP